MLSGAETDKDNYLLEESKENELNYEDSYEDEMEYVEVNDSQDNIQSKKKLYLENDDYLDEREIDREPNNRNILNNDIEQKFKERSISRKKASKRPVEQIQDTLDIEPIDKKEKSPVDNQGLDINEIDDPW